MRVAMYNEQFQSIQGPSDGRLRHSELEGYQPVSRIGEVVINSFGGLRTPPASAHVCQPKPSLTHRVCVTSRRLRVCAAA